MKTKLSSVKEAMSANDWKRAISLCARFPRLENDRAAILDAHAAYTNPRFMSQLGKDLDALKEAGRLALIGRFGE